MSGLDLNLLVTLDVLLDEGSVAGAARRLHLSPSAMSRALARLRTATGDPLLVRAGRGLVRTPRASELRDDVAQLVAHAQAVLHAAAKLDLARLERTFTLRTSDGFVENFGPALITKVARQAPNVRLRFVPKLDRGSETLRDGSVDLETGVVGAATGPEVRTRALFRDRFVGVVAARHPLRRGALTPARFAQGRHILVSRRGRDRAELDELLAATGLQREIVATVSGFAAALSLARHSDLIATVPERQTGNLRAGLHTFALPFATAPITVAMLWHPRMEADAAHRWLRGCVHALCADVADAHATAKRARHIPA